jgi:hypothetical protein
MSFASHTADAMGAAEADDDAARQAESERQLMGLTVKRLMESGLPKGSGDARFLERMDLRITVNREMPTKAEIERIKALAWTHRRRMPRTLAPKLPPHDPIVKEIAP